MYSFMERQASNSTTTIGKRWHRIKIQGAEYVILTLARENSWEIFLSNLVEIWTETITRDIALLRCQSLNLLLDLDSFDIKETLDVVLNDIPDHVAEISLTEIKLETPIEGNVFKFAVNLSKGNGEHFFNAITKPLCQSSTELQHRYQILLDLVKRKDEELSEYKLSGAQLTRRNIETQPYCPDTLRNLIFNRSSKSQSCIDEFISMVDFCEDSLNRESSLNIDHGRLSKDSGSFIPVKPDVEAEDKNVGGSGTLLTVAFNSQESWPRIKLEPSCENSSINSRQSEVTKQYEVSEAIPSANESNVYLKTKKNPKKRSTLNDMASAPLNFIEKPSKKPKSEKNIYDFIV